MFGIHGINTFALGNTLKSRSLVASIRASTFGGIDGNRGGVTILANELGVVLWVAEGVVT